MGTRISEYQKTRIPEDKKNRILEYSSNPNLESKLSQSQPQSEGKSQKEEIKLNTLTDEEALQVSTAKKMFMQCDGSEASRKNIYSALVLLPDTVLNNILHEYDVWERGL